MKRLSEEHKRKIGEANKKRLLEFYSSPKGRKRAILHSKLLKGRTLTDEHKCKIKNSAPRGINNHAWKGANASYRAIHIWLENNFGKPEKCEQCGSNGLTGRKIHWANKSGQYLRDRTDWLRLCAKCHVVLDGTINNILRKD